MEYGRIVSRSFEIAWEHKWLWIFGMFAAGTGLNLKFEYLMGTSATNPFDMTQMSQIDTAGLMAAYVGLIPLFLIMGLMVIFAKAAIIDSVNRIERGGTFSFSTAFSGGVDYFLRFLGLAIIFFVVISALMSVIALVVVLLFAVNNVLGGFGAFFAFFITFFLIFMISQMANNAYRVIVLRNTGILDGISEGVQLVKLHFGKNVAAFFIMFAFGIAFGVFTFIMWMMLNFPIDSIIQALNLTSIPAMFAAVIIGLPISFLIAGYFGLFNVTFLHSFILSWLTQNLNRHIFHNRLNRI